MFVKLLGFKMFELKYGCCVKTIFGAVDPGSVILTYSVQHYHWEVVVTVAIA